jgi:hypothetical protein
MPWMQLKWWYQQEVYEYIMIEERIGNNCIMMRLHYEKEYIKRGTFGKCKAHNQGGGVCKPLMDIRPGGSFVDGGK